MPDNPTIRNIREDELPQLIELYTHLHAVDDPLPEGDELASMWRAFLDDPHIHCIVAECDGRLVSSCTLGLVPNMTRGGRPYGMIENVVTHKDYRCRGLGTKVLQHALGIAWQSNCYKVMLLTGSKRPETLRFYEKAGFRMGTKTSFIAKPGA